MEFKLKTFRKINTYLSRFFFISKKLTLIFILCFLSFSCSGGGGGGGSSSSSSASTECAYKGSSYSGCYPAR